MTDNEARIKSLENDVEELKNSLSSFNFGKKPRRKKNDATKKTPSPYNLFVQKFLKEQKETLGDKYDHKKAFKDAGDAWQQQKQKQEK